MSGARELTLEECVRAAFKRFREVLASSPYSLPPGYREFESLVLAAVKSGQSWPPPATETTVDQSAMQAGTNGRKTFFSRVEFAEMTPFSERTIRRRIDAGLLTETPFGIPVSEINRLSNPKREKSS